MLIQTLDHHGLLTEPLCTAAKAHEKTGLKEGIFFLHIKFYKDISDHIRHFTASLRQNSAVLRAEAHC